MRRVQGMIGASVAVAVVGLLAAACGNASTSTAGPATSTGTPTSLNAELHRLVSLPGGPPGAIAIVQRGSRVQSITAGVGDVTTRQPIDADDTIRIASVSKAYNGAVALALVSRGQLALTDTIGQRLPSLPRAWWPVTLGQLLHHTSGVPDYIKSPAFLATFRSDPRQSLTPQQLLGFVSDEPLLFTPGSAYDYSDSDNIVVGLMVEEATGEPYVDALSQYVTSPLHLAGTTLPDDIQLATPYVHGYDVEPGKPPDDVSDLINPGLAWASGGMVSTPAQLNVFIRAYAEGLLVDHATRTAQLTFVPGSSGPPGPGTNAAGLGIYRYRTSCGTVYGHTGNLPGYTLFAAATPDGDDSAVVVVNEQLNSKPVTTEFTALRQAEQAAVCLALR